MRKLRQEAEVMKGHAWLERFRKGNVSMSGTAGQDIAHYVDRLLEKVIAGCTDRTIVCLCGSTRFYEAFQRANYDETMAGKIVLSVGHYPHSSEQAHGESVGCTPEQKIALDELHKRKIDLADEVYVLNVGGYIGDSTRSELEYAREHGKAIRFLEPEQPAV